MPTAKTIVKKASRRRGSVSLTKVRKAVAEVFHRNKGRGRAIRAPR